jgi:hypothetical protein
MQPARLQPAVGVGLHPLESEGVLFDQHAQRMFHLNSTAICIWRHIQQNAEPALAAKGVADSLAIDQATALAYTLEMAERWRDFNLLDDGQPKRNVRLDRRQSIAKVAGGGSSTNSAIACRRHYALLGTVVSLGFLEKRLEETVHPTLSHLEVSASRPVDLAIDIVISATRYEIWCNGCQLDNCASLSGVAPMANAQMFHLAIGRWPHVMALHSGALASPQGCLLMPAASGSGKSTLTAALCRAGWRYMADDIVLLEHDSLSAIGVPNALGIKAGAWNILESRYPELATITPHDRIDGKRIRYVAPPSWIDPEAIETEPIRWIIFPRYGPGISAEMSPLTAAEGFHRLMAHCCGLPGRLTQEQVNGMIRWIADIACFEMTFSDLDLAVRAINAHCVEPRRP